MNEQQADPTSPSRRSTFDEPLLTVPEIAARLRVGAETVRQWLRTGKLRGHNLGGRSGWRVPEAEVERMLAGRRTT